MSHRQVKRVRRAARTAFFTAVSLDLLAIALPAHAQDAQNTQEDTVADTLDEIVVRGVRGAQEAGIDMKRNNAQITDSIVMEDIGKLPDVTITDALQRVPGIQISRAAGEGSLVAVRGAQQVMATMNGERFVTAEDILDSTANFEDLPASLVTGVTVYKSQSADLTDGGLGGLLDLQSIRALKLPNEGLTLSLAGQGGWGSIVDGIDKKFEGLVGFKFSDRLGMSLAASYSDSEAAATFQSAELDLVDEFSGWINPGNLPAGDLNGDGDATDEFLIPNGWNTSVNSRTFERKRLGLAYNFDMQLSDSMELVADVFYNDMDEAQHGQQLFVNGNFGGRQVFRPYTVSTGNPSVVESFDTDGLVSRANFVTDFIGDTNGLRGGVQSVFRQTTAVNTNLELRMGKGEKYSSTLRWVHADADRSSKALTVAQQTDSACFPTTQAQADAAGCTDINPTSIPTTLTYQISNGLGSDQMSFAIGDQLRQLASAPSAWRMHSSWLERNSEDIQMDVLRYDGKLEVNDGFSFEFGARASQREMNEERSDYFSPSGLNGLLAKYEEVGYGINQTSNTAGFDYDPLARYTLASPQLAGFVTNVNSFGVNGLTTGFPMINTRALEHPESIRDALYGEGQYIDAPDRTYGVEEAQTSFYFKGNFDTELTSSVKMSGNIGVRVVNTNIRVFQNLTDGTQLDPRILAGSDPNHTAYTDLGDVFTSTDRTRALPSFNLNFDFGDEWKVKTAYFETQALQPLQNLGRGPITFYNGEQIGETFQRVNSIQRLGNPRLEPWLSRTMSTALEWYPREHTLVSAGLFYTDVDSYTFTRVGTDTTAPDSDGVVRLGAQTQDIEQGEGASYYGLEFAYQATFDFLPSFLKYTGVNLNYTFTPSQAGKNAATGETIKLANGDDAPFNGTAENQLNMVLFYQDAKFQARIAANYLSKQYVGAFTHWSFTAPNAGLAQWQDSTLYIDAGASFDVNDHFQVFVQGSNLTEESPAQYVQWPDAHLNWTQFERVITAGVRAKF
ncbi:MAG TPA: TonB-dependent receptor [Steroidobacteraceae bacterium]|jgi:TonB-dependent receptor|nr:TonB-dependent receptor [Steroidobacteraceae bacterium]